MEISECPVLKPTYKEFKNFSEFVEKVDRLYKNNYGMVKVTTINSQNDLLRFYFTFLQYPRLCHLLNSNQDAENMRIG